MKWPESLQRILRVPRLTPLRIVGALTIAVITDGLQFFTGVIGWAGFDEVLDGLAMVLITWLLGFHVLLLPTFLVELVPVVDDLPTWTACTAAVIVLRRKEQKAAAKEP